jgi:hypothetical protein
MATVTALATYRTAPGRLLELVRCTAALDREAFTRLHDALAPAVTATVGELTDDPVRADAITSATFVTVWQTAIANTAAGTNVTAWVIDIAVRLAAEPADPPAGSRTALKALLSRGPGGGRTVGMSRRPRR